MSSLEEALAITEGVEVAGGELLEGVLAGEAFLDPLSDDSELSEAAVLELLELEGSELFRVLLEGVEVRAES